MGDLLSLPDELIEIVGKHAIGTDQAGLREWCRATSTCTRLWKMDLPGSASSCHLDLDNDIRGAPWVMERIQTVRNLSIKGDEDQMVRLDAEVLYQITKSMIRLSGSFKNLATLTLQICESDPFPFNKRWEDRASSGNRHLCR
ncbi:g8431 [Coccomyxa viridis]|uniref:G8431 protein n=1 Tax=Coccomyxa viridis TaxID=1274662 RepID=A0ABP1G4G1_9CHLO